MSESLIDAIDRKAATAQARSGVCPCGSPITVIDYDTSHGFRVKRASRYRIRFECGQGHVQDFHITSRVAMRLFTEVRS